MPNPSSTAFDAAFDAISNYQAFPAMRPFVGKDYVSTTHARLLILGESFYFPEDSLVHKEAGNWYAMKQGSLTEEEVTYINCRQLLECDWGSPGHKMYREINRCLAELDLPSQDDRPVSHISYTNTFSRPARDSGGSFKDCCVDQDVVESIRMVTKVIEALSPNLVIFVSKYAWDVIGANIAKQISEPKFDFVSHPTDPFHWNVESYQHGRRKFVTLLKEWAAKAT
jgi:hypothetical protein